MIVMEKYMHFIKLLKMAQQHLAKAHKHICIATAQRLYTVAKHEYEEYFLYIFYCI